MKRILGLVVALCAIELSAAGTVSDVKARQRYPWNGKVDIDCTLSGTAGTSYALTVNARDKVGCTNLAVKAVSVEGGSATGNPVLVTPGTYRLVWDAGADLPNGFRGEKISISVSVSESATGKKFMIVDLASGAITYQASAPSGGWNANPYKTTKMALQRIEAGTFWQCESGLSGRNVTITKPFYVGVYPLTGGQCYVLTGMDRWTSGDTSYYTFSRYHLDSSDETFHYHLRGNETWPREGHAVTSGSIVGKLRSKCGKDNFDIPTLGQLGLAAKSMSLTDGGVGCLDFASRDLGEAAVVDPVGPVNDMYKTVYQEPFRMAASADGKSLSRVHDAQARICFWNAEQE